MVLPNQAGSLQGSRCVSSDILTANDPGTGSGWHQSKQNWALPAVVGYWARMQCSDPCCVQGARLHPYSNCLGARPAHCFQRPQAPMTVWPSGLRRWFWRRPPSARSSMRRRNDAPTCKGSRWAEARIKIARMTLTIKLDGNWSSFQLANSAPPLSVTDSAIAPSARIPSTERLRMLRRATNALCTRQ